MEIKYFDTAAAGLLWTKIKNLLGTKVDKAPGKGLSTEDFTSEEKGKLAGIEAGANSYSLPVASAEEMGGIKPGTGLDVSSDGVLSFASSCDFVRSHGTASGWVYRKWNSGLLEMYTIKSVALGTGTVHEETFSVPAVCMLNPVSNAFITANADMGGLVLGARREYSNVAVEVRKASLQPFLSESAMITVKVVGYWR